MPATDRIHALLLARLRSAVYMFVRKDLVLPAPMARLVVDRLVCADNESLNRSLSPIFALVTRAIRDASEWSR